jgi:hypothetical protein
MGSGIVTADEVPFTSMATRTSPSTVELGLGFYRGVELADPARLLEGTGKKMRHKKIRTLADVANPALHDLVVAAAAHDPSPLSHLRGGHHCGTHPRESAS